MDTALVRVSEGDENARTGALNAHAEARRLIDSAGGVSRLEGRWDDADVAEMNKGLAFAEQVYDIEMFALANPVKRLRGEVSMHNVTLAREGLEKAERYYRMMK